MEDEDQARGGGDRLPSSFSGEFSGAVVDPDTNADHTPAQPSHSAHLSAMSDRDRRSRVERACSNIPTAQSRNSRRHDDQAGGSGAVPEARNRHRDRNAPTTSRHRPGTATSSSGSQRESAAEAEAMMEDDSDGGRCNVTDDATVAVTSDLTLLPILQTGFVLGADSSVTSAHNWQVC